MHSQSHKCDEVLLGETLKCTPDFIFCFWKQVLSNLDYEVDNEYEITVVV